MNILQFSDDVVEGENVRLCRSVFVCCDELVELRCGVRDVCFNWLDLWGWVVGGCLLFECSLYGFLRSDRELVRAEDVVFHGGLWRSGCGTEGCF